MLTSRLEKRALSSLLLCSSSFLQHPASFSFIQHPASCSVCLCPPPSSLQGLKGMGSNLSDKDILRLFKDSDLDGNGSIDYQVWKQKRERCEQSAGGCEQTGVV